MNKLSLFLAVSFLSTLGLIVQSSKQEIFPFEKKPELSWSQFEQGFRKKYPNIDIPKLILDNDCDFAPMYIYDLNDEYLTKFNEHKAEKQKPPFIIMNIKATGLLAPAQIEHVLLHEVGHHNYNSAQREQNHARAKHIADHVHVGFSYALQGLNLGLLYRNFYPIMQKTISKKALIAQIVALGMYFKMAEMQKVIATLCDDVIGTRPEEFAADDFANQHATKETLQAAQNIYLKESFVDRQYFDFVQDVEMDKNIQAMDPEAQAVIIKVASYMNSLERFLLSGIYNVHGLFAPSHPSPSVRRHIVAQALKDRFGDKQNN